MHGTVILPDRTMVEAVHRSGRQQGNPISVCHVTEGAAWAGAEVQLTTLLRALSKCPDISLHALVFHESRLASELRHFGVAVQVVDAQRQSLLSLLAECSEFVKSKKIQILHSHSYKENLIACLLSRVCKVKYLVRTEHGHPEPYSAIRHPKHCCVLAADRIAARYTATKIVSVSSDLGEFWKRHVGAQRVAVLRNGVDVEWVNSKFGPSEARQRLGIPGDASVVGIAARLELIKRHDLFLATARYLASKVANVKFVIAGDGRQKVFLQRLIYEYGLEDQVSLLGERKDVHDVLRAMDILLICSDHEGVPMVMLESMALGIPVVSRKVGGIPEVIRDGENGLLIASNDPEEIGDACMSIFQDPCRRASLVQAARDEIQRLYSAEKNAEVMLEVYRSVCRSSP
jgi:L-malate glycosyltransferase